MLAEIRTCEYFILCYEAISIFSPWYIEMSNSLFENLMRQFLHDLQIKREKRYKQLQQRKRKKQEQEQEQLQLHFKEIVNEIYPVDFEQNNCFFYYLANKKYGYQSRLHSLP